MIYVNFVCTGNTCRSPIAEMLLKHELRQLGLSRKVRVSSSGTHASFASAINPYSRAALKSMGVAVSKFLSKPYVYKEGEFVIAMTDEHKRYLPFYAKAVSINDLTGEGDVSDPFMGSAEDYLKTARTLKDAMPFVLEYILGKDYLVTNSQ